MSVSCGIPNFRSAGVGLYDTLRPELLTATEPEMDLIGSDTTLALDRGLFLQNATHDANEADDGDGAAFLRRCLSPKPPVHLPLTKDEADATDDTDGTDGTDNADEEAVLRRRPPCRRPPLPPQS